MSIIKNTNVHIKLARCTSLFTLKLKSEIIEIKNISFFYCAIKLEKTRKMNTTKLNAKVFN